MTNDLGSNTTASNLEPLMVISLPRSTDRRGRFAARNKHLQFEFVDAADGHAMTKEEIMATRLFAHNLDYKPGAFGVAISHARMWELAIRENRSITICEDDAILGLNFRSQSRHVLEQLPPDWDLVYWGWNFDAVHAVTIGPTVPFVIKSNEIAMRQQLGKLRQLKYNSVPMRLMTAFGSFCYSISPKGASRFRELVFPLKNEVIDIYGLGTIANISKDIAMARDFRKIKAFSAFPPLAFSENLKSESTIWNPEGK